MTVSVYMCVHYFSFSALKFFPFLVVGMNSSFFRFLVMLLALKADLCFYIGVNTVYSITCASDLCSAIGYTKPRIYV